MKLTESDLQQLYRNMTTRRARAAGDCPGEEVLIQAASNGLDSAQRAGLVTHLARCSDCAREYHIARSLRDLGSEGKESAPDRPSWWAVAAAVVIALLAPLLVVLGIGWQGSRETIARLEQQIASERVARAAGPPPQTAATSAPPIAQVIRPDVGVPIVDLDPGLTRGESAGIPTIVIPPTSEIFTLILHVNELSRSPMDMELVNDAGDILWKDRLAADPTSASIPIALNRRTVPAGAYSIRVRSAGRERRFPFRVGGKRN
jgi:hypothetical protein